MNDLKSRLGFWSQAHGTCSEHPLLRMLERLTPAEGQLVVLAVLGLSNQELAHRRHISESTAVNHLSSAYRKLGVASRRELRALINGSCEASERRAWFVRSLSPRELVVLQCAEQGQSNKLIAHSLGVAISTVATLLARARRKCEFGAEGRGPVTEE